MSSELWQRLKAVRSFADRRQEDIAKVCKVSRGAVAQWESKDPNNRTRPSITQVQAVSKETGVPVEWILNDAVDVADVWQVGKIFHQTPSVSAPVERSVSIAPASGERMLNAFKKAVEYAILERDPALADGFDAAIGHGPVAVVADFVCGRAVAVFSTTVDGCLDPGTLGRLLLLERAAGKNMTKLLICSQGNENENAAQITEHLLATFGIKVIPVSSPAEAAECLIKCCGSPD